MLVDSHCHINFAEFDADLAQVLARAKEAGVEMIQLIATKFSEIPKISQIAQTRDNIKMSIGIHPCNVAQEAPCTVEDLLHYAKDQNVNAIGETGLDFYHSKTHQQEQIKSFQTHITAARILDFPVIIHTREAGEKTLEVLREEKKNGDFKFLIHCFTEDAEFAEEVLALGGFISISGIVTFKNAVNLQQIVKNIPLERLLIETDAPYLAPMPYRGKRNEPAFLKHTALYLAELLSVDYELLKQQTSQNYLQLFKATKQ
jgi:TatD DNase family protein